MFKKDYETAKEFSREFLPILKGIVKAKEIISFEDLDNESLPQIFDRYAGVDAITIDKTGIRGIALRTQYNMDAKTFTIRYKRSSGTKTEFQKRIEAIERGYIYPYLTCQCYYDKENHKLLSGAVCRTKDLYQYILDNIKVLETRKRVCPEGNSFLWVRFEDLKKMYNVFIIDL